MVDAALAFLFAVAGVAAAFFVPGRPRFVVVLLHGAIYGFTVSAALVVLQRLVLNHFFELDFLPTAETPLDLFLLAGVNAASFVAGFFAGQFAERYAAPWRAARRRPPAGPAPSPPAP